MKSNFSYKRLSAAALVAALSIAMPAFAEDTAGFTTYGSLNRTFGVPSGSSIYAASPSYGSYTLQSLTPSLLANGTYANVLEAIRATDSPRSYTTNGTEVITENIGTMTGDLTLSGSIDMNGKTGISVSSGATLHFSGSITNGVNTWYRGTITSVGGDIFIDNSTFSNNTTNYEGGRANGSAVNIQSGDLTITNSTFSNNVINDEAPEGTWSGGAVVHGGHHPGTFSPHLTFTNVNFYNNRATNNNGGQLDGGALAVNNNTIVTINGGTYSGNILSGNGTKIGGAIGLWGNPSYNISNLTITNNRIEGTGYSAGGGMSLGSEEEFPAPPSGTLSNLTITNNYAEGTAVYGGGLRAWGNIAIPDNTITGNTINASDTGSGGGVSIYNQESDLRMDITGGSISSNTVSAGDYGNGGGLTAYGGGIIYANGTEFNNNIINASRGQGGGIHITYSSGTGVATDMSLSNAKVNNNEINATTRAQGGGIASQTNNELTINNSEISGNTITGAEAGGGGIYSAGTLDITSTHITNNTVNGTSFGRGGGIYGRGDISIKSSTISGNEAGEGGGIYLADNVNSLFLESTTFASNTADYGGAVYNNATKEFSIAASVTNNSATYGGGIYNADTAGTLNVNDTFLIGNRAEYGGAIYNASDLNLQRTNTQIFSSISSNTADYGGAIYNEATMLIDEQYFSGNSAVNSGGAIYNTASGELTISNTDFDGNYTTSSTLANADGGAILNYGGEISVSNSTFTNNYTPNNTSSSASTTGGAISNTNSGRVVITGSEFSRNHAYADGAIESHGGELEIQGSTFTSNEATNLSGGAIGMANNADVTIQSTNFNSNTARTYGGAVHSAASDLTISNNTDFASNTAQYGGAVALSGTTANISGSDFTSNSASSYGGAVYNINGTTQINSSVFGASSAGNRAQNGGAVYNGSSGRLTAQNTNFTSNSATSNGGAVYNEASGRFSALNASFTSNSASSYGGAIYNTGSSTITSIDDSTFTSNSASRGGAIYNNSGSRLTLKDTNLTNNTASSYGGAIYNAGTMYILADDTTVNISGNRVGSRSNAIHNTGTLYLNAYGSRNLNITDAMTGSGTIYVNDSGYYTNTNFGSASLPTSGTVYVANDMSGYTGNVYIENGTLEFYKGNSSHNFFGNGVTVQGGTLELNLAQYLDLDGQVDGYGYIDKTGSATLYLEGDNSGFDGDVTIYNGIIRFDRNSVSDEYFSGSTSIQSGTSLDFYINNDYTLDNKLTGGSGTFNKYGANTLTISGDNSGYTGITNINAGKIYFSKTSSSDRYFSGQTNINSGSSLEFYTGVAESIAGKIAGSGQIIKSGNANLTISQDNSSFNGTTTINAGRIIFDKNSSSDKYFNGTTNITSNGTLEYDLAAADAISGSLTGNGNFVKSGTATLTLNGDNSTFSGTTTVNNGTLRFNKNTSSDRYFNGNTRVNSSGTLEFALNSTENLTGSVSGTGKILKSGSSTLNVSSDNSGFTGNTRISVGQITFNKNSSADKFFGGTTTIDSGAVLNYNLNVDETLTSVLAGNGTFNKNNNGLLTIVGDNSAFSGTTNINTGKVLFDKNSSTDRFLGGYTNVNSGTVLEFDTAVDEVLTGRIGGSGSLIKSGIASVTLVQDNSVFSGDTVIEEGRLIFRKNSESDKYFTGKTEINSGAELVFQINHDDTFSSQISGNGTFTKAGTQVLTVNGDNSSFDGNITVEEGILKFDKNSDSDVYFRGHTNIEENGTLQFATAVDEVIQGAVSGNGRFLKTGSATLTLSDDNSAFSGQTQISEGEIVFNKNSVNDKFFRGTTIIDSNASLDFNLNSEETLNNNLKGTGTFNKNGSALLTVIGDNSGYTGKVNINEGAVLFDKNTENDRFFGGITELDPYTILEFDLEMDEIMSGSIIGSGSIIKDGSATLQIDSDNSGFTGEITIVDGKIVFDKDTENSKYLGGTTNIEATGELNYNISLDDAIKGTVSGTGTFTKDGEAVLTITEDNSKFEGTTVIQNGKILFDKNNTNDKYFDGNTVIENGGQLEYRLETSDSITGNISGTGELIKSGAGQLSISGDNSAFSGTAAITEGSVVFNKNSVNDKYFTGITDIGSGTLFEYNTAVSDSINAEFTGDGTFHKTGAQTLALSGNNSGFSGEAIVDNGKLQFVKDENADLYFGGNTLINSSGTLEYNLSVDEQLADTVSGTGTFTKTGEATLYLNGNNDNFTGHTIIDNGKIAFEKTNLTKYFNGTTTINTDGVLQYTTTVSDSINGQINGTGILLKDGADTLNIIGDNSVFNGTTVIDAGNILFEKTNTNTYLGGETVINQDGTLDYITTNADTINGNISGTGSLNKSGAQALTLTGDNSGFQGVATIQEGQLVFEKTNNSSYLDGITIITENGSLEYTTTAADSIDGNIQGAGDFNKYGAEILSLNGDNSLYTGTFSINDGRIIYNKDEATDEYFSGITNVVSELEFNTSIGETLASKIEGGGIFIKSGDDTLEVEGNQSDFTGTVEISGGTLSYTTPSSRVDKSFFNSSAINIYNLNDVQISNLDYNFTNNASFDRLVNLNGNAALNLTAVSGVSAELNENINTSGENNTANFTGGTYIFNKNSLASFTGETNVANFNNTISKLSNSVDTFGNNQLNAEYTNSSIDMRNDKIGDSIYNNLILTGANKLYIDLDLKNHEDQAVDEGEAPEADRLVIDEGSSGEIEIKDVSIIVDGKWANKDVQVVSGDGVTIKDFDPYLSATSTDYIYEIVKADTEGWITVSTVDYTEEPDGTMTLKMMHNAEGNRGFTVHNRKPIYYVLSNLGEMGKGEFNVSGQSKTDSVITGNTLWSLFNVDSTDGDSRILNISNVKIANASAEENTTASRTNGAAVYITGDNSTLNVNNTIFEANKSLNGGAIYAEGGVIDIIASEFTGNEASGNGGAFYNNSNNATMSHVTFNLNTSDNGGALYNTGEITLTDSSFTNNTANTGGAIYNTGELTLNTNKDTFTIFENNSAELGKDIYNNGGSIRFTGEGTVNIYGGIAGTGSIIKDDAGLLILQGDNSQYTGDAVINSGKILFNKLTENDSYITGITEIKQDGILEYNLAAQETFNGTQNLTGDGTFIKSGDADLLLTGANSSFAGAVNIQSGAIIYDQSEGGSYFGGSTIIAEGASLEYTNSSDDNINNISGEGAFTKKGTGIVNLGGQNNNYTGNAVIEEGTLRFNKTDTTEFFGGQTTVESAANLEYYTTSADNIHGNIDGNGTITKTGSENLTITGDNRGFTGTVIINDGTITFEKTDANQYYFDANTIINSEGELVYQLDTEEIISGTIDGTGEFTKTGNADLTLTGNNSGFTGIANIEQGIVNYLQSENGTYFAGRTNLTTTLNFNNSTTENMNGLLGAGVLNKYGEGILNLNKVNQSFTGTINIEEGTVSYNKTDAADSFVTGTVNLKEDTTLNLNINVQDSVNAVITGIGQINKNGTENLILSGQNSGYTGNFAINSGNVSYQQSQNGSYFGGTTFIAENSSLEFVNTITEEIKDISGSGAFVKNGSGILNLKGDNSDYTGTVDINNGTLVFSDADSKFFNSEEINIEGQEVNTANLDYKMNSEESSFTPNINLNGNSSLLLHGNGSNTIHITQPILTSSINNVAAFDNGTFVMDNSLSEFGQNASDTKLTFSNSIIKMGENTSSFGSNALNADFVNSTLDLADGKINDLIFNNLNFTGDNNKIKFELDLQNNKDQYMPTTPDPVADTVNYANGSGSITVEQISVIVNGEWTKKEINVLNKTGADGGQITMNDFGMIELGTSSGYEYQITKSENEGNIIISTVDYEVAETLKKMHISNSPIRNFNFDTETDSPYRVLSNLETMGEGKFYVTGLDKDESIITANHLWTLFDVDSEDGQQREFYLNNVTIEHAVINEDSNRADGTALYIKGEAAGAQVTNTNFYNNKTETGNGGAVYNEGGNASFTSVIFDSNSAVNGGAAGTTGTTSIDKTIAQNNSAVQNGGAIYNTGSLHITDSGFENNKAETGSGGAIYNTGELQITATEGNQVYFDNNTANNQANDIHSDGRIVFDGKGQIVINSGITGTGTIEKNDEGTLFLGGKNNNFTGIAAVNGGTLYFEKTDDTSYLNVNTSINTEGTVVYKTTAEDTINGTINGSGTLIKTGGETLILTGKNNGFNGSFYVEEGGVNYNQSAGGSYFNGSTNIAQNSTLNFNNTEEDNIKNVSGGGEFVKTGDGTLNLTGQNDKFTGNANIIEGTLAFNDKDDGTFFNGITTINEDAVLSITNNNENQLARIKGDGLLTKDGSGTLNLQGDNSEFTGDVEINEGKVFYQKKYKDDNYFSGKTTINENGELEFNFNGPQTLNTKLHGNGTFTKSGSGTLYLEGDNTTFAGNMNLAEGSIRLAKDALFFDVSAMTMHGGTTFDTRNGSMDTINFGNLTLNDGAVNLGLDINLDTQTGDFFSADSVTGDSALTIKYLDILSDGYRAENHIPIASTENAFSQSLVLDPSLSTIWGSIYKYNVGYDPDNGYLNLTCAAENSYQAFNPAITAAPVATMVGAYLVQLDSLIDAFGNMDMLMLLPKSERTALLTRNRYAASDGSLAFLPGIMPEQYTGAWFRPYSTFESVRLDNGPRVNNVMYGSLFGVDSPIIPLKHGINAVYTVYAGYNGSHQTYDGVSIYQNGGLLGGTAAFYKDNFYTGITANVGAMAGEANTMFGREDITTLHSGIAIKSGYNWELLNGRFVVQPNFMLSYAFINTFDYTNPIGVRLDASPLHAIQYVPGVKLIGNLKNGWQPYINVQVVANIMDITKFTANEVALPEMSVDPYVLYGIGLQRRIADDFTGYLHTMLRSGGRNGIGFQFGFRWRM